MAAAYVLFHCLQYENEKIIFESKAGVLNVTRNDEYLVMDFPAQAPTTCELPTEILSAFNFQPIECLKAEDYIVVLEDEAEVLTATPDFELLKRIDLRAVIITDKSTEYDFVSRCFAPKYGIKEDPVTGSAHTQLVPYWSKKLGKN